MFEGVAILLWGVYFYIVLVILTGWAWGWLLLVPISFLLIFWQGGEIFLPLTYFLAMLPILLERTWLAAVSQSAYRSYANWPKEAVSVFLTGLSLGALLGPSLGTGIWAWLGSYSFGHFNGRKVLGVLAVTLVLRVLALVVWTGTVIASTIGPW